jgi:hypothetical protein
MSTVLLTVCAMVIGWRICHICGAVSKCLKRDEPVRCCLLTLYVLCLGRGTLYLIGGEMAGGWWLLAGEVIFALADRRRTHPVAAAKPVLESKG